MELEHVFQQTTYFMTLQAVFLGSLYMVEEAGRSEMVRGFIRGLANAVVNIGPISLLLYVLYEISRLS